MRLVAQLGTWTRVWLETLESTLFPMSCLVCEADGCRGPFCDSCRLELHEASQGFCPRCALPVSPWSLTTRESRHRGRHQTVVSCAWCRGRSLGFDAALALGPYQGPIRDACLRLKHARDAWLAPWLADLLIEVHAETLRQEAIRARERGNTLSVVPVPIHWWRRRQRGYNQAEALARRVANRLDWTLDQPLRRIASTRRLSELNRRERAAELRRAIRVGGHGITQGQTVVLVDDILTTGATCGAAARALKQAGAARVLALVVARAEGTR